jgi:hypothetical protein
MPEIREWDLLNERQQSQAEDLAELVLEFGKFDQSTGADGAHYAPAKLNPFPELVCRSCVFFDELNNGCQIVTGSIEPEAVCKLWIIPEAALSLPTDQITSREQLDTMTSEEVMAAKSAGRLDFLLGK